MRRLMFACAGVAAFALATPVMAESAGGTFRVKVAASVEPECRFDTGAISVLLTNDQKTSEGHVDFYCNFDSAIHTNFRTTSGKLTLNGDGDESVPYEFYVGTRDSIGQWQKAGDFTGEGLDGTYGNHAPAGQTESHYFGFRLIKDIRKAGIYTDSFTLSFAP